MINKHIPQFVYLIVAVLISLYMAYQAYGYSLAYEHNTIKLTEQLYMSDNFKTTSKKYLEKMTFSWYDGYSEQINEMESLKYIAEQHKSKYHKYSKLFVALLLLLLLIHLAMQSMISVLTLVFFSVIALVTGLFTPVLAIVAYQDLPILGHTILQFESKSIITALQKLYTSGQWVVAALIFLFTILTPIIKSILMILIIFSNNMRFSQKSISFLKTIGKWSMLDVFVIAILVTYFTTKAGGATDATLQPGVYFFTLYVILSMLLTYIINFKNNVIQTNK